MRSKFETAIFQEEFTSNLSNWKLYDYKEYTCSVFNSQLKFINDSPKNRNLIFTSGIVLPPYPKTSFIVEAKLKFSFDLGENEYISLLAGNANLKEYYKISFNQSSFVQIVEKRKQSILGLPKEIQFFDSQTNYEILEGFNSIKIEYDSVSNLMKYYLNDNFIFNNIYSGLKLSHIGLECAPDGSMYADSIIVKI